MGNSTVKSHQATEVRLKNRRNVNRPLRPMPSRAIEAGSGMAVVESGGHRRASKPVSAAHQQNVLLDQMVGLGGVNVTEAGGRMGRSRSWRDGIDRGLPMVSPSPWRNRCRRCWRTDPDRDASVMLHPERLSPCR